MATCAFDDLVYRQKMVAKAAPIIDGGRPNNTNRLKTYY